jgi:protein-L-isoaspartate O-methyltransferase
LLIRELLEFPFLPTPPTVVDVALSLLKLDDGAVFADLGCGEGNVLVQAAQKFGAYCVGFEIDPRLLPQAKRNVKVAGLNQRVDMVHGDLFSADFSRFDAIYVYPFPPIAAKLAEKLRGECRRGAKVVVCDYPLPNLVAAQTVEVAGKGLLQHRIYIYAF